jgi:glutathione S-transferase
MARRLWGRLSSVNVQKAVWCLEELGLPYARVDAGGAFGVVDTPAYRRLNPTGLVPTLEEDGFVLWESNAIVRYLAHAHGGLWPEGVRARAEADRWMDWQATNWTPAMRDAFWGLIRTAPEARDEAAVAASVAKSEAGARLLDAALEGRRFLVGDAFSVADVAAGCAAHRWLHLPIARPALPALEGWYARLAQRPTAGAAFLLPLS